VDTRCRAGQATDDNIIRCMRIACWIPNATNTHSEYVILTAFPPQQWLRERVSVLRYIYIVCLVELCTGQVGKRVGSLHHWISHKVFFLASVTVLVTEYCFLVLPGREASIAE
jgi:hypothetical protein